MSKHDITRDITTCPVCHVSYCPHDGEICKCPEEPVVSNWEDIPSHQPEPKDERDWVGFALSQMSDHATRQ
jgi:hypothetical protein